MRWLSANFGLERAMSKDRVDPRRESLPDAPPDNPNRGALAVVVDGQSVVLSEALHWVEDGEHVISSCEFQVASSAGSFREAFEQMIENLFEEVYLLNARIRKNEAAPNELDEALLLAERFTQIAELENARLKEADAARATGRRRRRSRGNRWVVPRGGRQISRQPSVV